MSTAHGERLTFWQLFILLLSVYVLCAMLAEIILRPMPYEVALLLNRIDTGICFIFIGDFFYNLFTAKRKLHYLKWGWIDLVSSMPNVQFLRWGRFVRVVRVLRILRGARSTRVILSALFRNGPQATFLSTALVSFFIVIFGAISILHCETTPNGNIRSAGDALWWAFTTVTTVSYGEFYPVTIEGRIIAGLLMIAGVGVFGTFTAYIASVFLGMSGRAGEPATAAQIDHLEKRVAHLEKSLHARPPGGPDLP